MQFIWQELNIRCCKSWISMWCLLPVCLNLAQSRGEIRTRCSQTFAFLSNPLSTTDCLVAAWSWSFHRHAIPEISFERCWPFHSTATGFCCVIRSMHQRQWDYGELYQGKRDKLTLRWSTNPSLMSFSWRAALNSCFSMFCELTEICWESRKGVDFSELNDAREKSDIPAQENDRNNEIQV